MTAETLSKVDREIDLLRDAWTALGAMTPEERERGLHWLKSYFRDTDRQNYRATKAVASFARALRSHASTKEGI